MFLLNFSSRKISLNQLGLDARLSFTSSLFGAMIAFTKACIKQQKEYVSLCFKIPYISKTQCDIDTTDQTFPRLSDWFAREPAAGY